MMRLAQGYVDPSSGIAFGDENPYVPPTAPAPAPLIPYTPEAGILPAAPAAAASTTPTVAPIADTITATSSSASAPPSSPVDTITVTAAKPSFWEKYGLYVILAAAGAVALSHTSQGRK